MQRNTYSKLVKIASIGKEADLQDDIKHTWQGIKSWFSADPVKSDTSRLVTEVAGNIVHNPEGNKLNPIEMGMALPKLNKHLNKYDADPNTPGLQLVNSSTGIDNTESLLRDADTLKLGYNAYHTLGDSGISSYKKGVEDDANKAYEQYLNSFGEATRKNAQGRDAWTKDWIQKNNPAYYAMDRLAAIGKGVDYKNGQYVAKNDWANRTADIYGQLKNYRNADGSINMSKLTTDLAQNNPDADKLDTTLQDANILFTDPNTAATMGAIGAQFGDKLPKALSAYSAMGGRSGLQSLNFLQQAADNRSLFFTPEGRQHLDNANKLIGNNQLMGQLKDLSPDIHKQLSNNAGRLSWLSNNYDAASNLHSFQQNPIMFILKNLFSGNAGGLYSVINSMGKMYNPKTMADTDWNKYLVGDNKQMQSYAQYLPWMQMLGNIRSTVGGDGVSFG